MIGTWLLGTFIIAYTLGSIPFGLLITRMGGTKDIRTIGSGSIGATNVMRTGRKGLAILTLVFDAGKGIAAVWLVRHFYGQGFAPLAGFFAVIGHVFPVWLRFKGGKGVATALGVFFALSWLLGLAVCLLWAAVFAFTRISALASLISLSFSSIPAYALGNDSKALLCLVMALLIIYTHRSNIARMLQGTEYVFKKGLAP